MSQVADFVSVIVRREQAVLLVQQSWDGDQAYWTLPGGQVEAGESATAAALREVHEEAGLTIATLGNVAYRVEMQQADDSRTRHSICYETEAWSGVPQVNDPDDLVTAAQFFDLREALYKISELDYRVTVEPAISYLQGTVPHGTLFRYRMFAPFAVERL